MKIARLAGLMLVAVMAVSLAVASAAFAEPEFKPSSGTFKGTSTTGTLKAGGNEINCTADTSSGTITGTTSVGSVTVDFTGCKATNSKKEVCTVKSSGTTTEGLILTKTLNGALGLILPKGSGAGVGLLLLPVTKQEFVTITSTKCTPETTVEGTVAGEVSPVAKGAQITGKLVFAKGTTGESIKSFDPSVGGKTAPELEAFGAEASEETTEAITFSTSVEVS